MEIPSDHLALAWDKLRRLNECANDTNSDSVVAEIETDWETTVAGQSLAALSPEVLDDFFARWLATISKSMEDDRHERVWWPRLCDYLDARQGFLEEFRPYMYRRADRQELRRYRAPFDVWDLCVADQDRDTATGRYYQSYRLELAARLAPTWTQREQYFRQAAHVCFEPPLPASDPLFDALRRRGLFLESHAFRVSAFSLLNTNPADLKPVEDKFREALHHALLAEDVWEDNFNTHPDYLGFWAEAVGLRRAEVEGQLTTARLAHAAAEAHLHALADPDSLFKEPNLWWNAADFRRETAIIDVLEALTAGPAGLSRARDVLSEWVSDSQRDLADTLRLTRMQLRLQSVELLVGIHAGQDVTARVPGLFAELGKYSAVGRHTWEIANQVELAARGRTTLSEAVTRVARLLPIDTHGPAGAAALSKGRWYLLPHWYEATLAKYYVRGEAPAAVLLLLWYVRTVADYIWQVYAKNLAEQGLPTPTVTPDFMLASLTELRRALHGLMNAVCWSGSPGRALQSLVDILTEALHASTENVASDILPAVIEDTSRPLYPQPLRAENSDVSYPGALIATRFNQGERRLVLDPVPEHPPPGTYFYVKPRFKQSEGFVRQEGPINVYPALAFGEPRPVVVICEGITDQVVLEAVLDEVDPSWRQLQIRIVPAEGDSTPARYAAFKAEHPVVIADSDKRYGVKGKAWNRMWETCCYAFILDPDLERLRFDALAAALGQYWPCGVSENDLRRISSASRTGKAFEAQVSAHYGQPPFKSFAFATIVASKIIEFGSPAILKDIAAHVLRLANGRRVPCRNDATPPFHHCLT